MRVLSFCLFFALATGIGVGQNSIVDEIEKEVFGKGTVRIHQAPNIAALLGSKDTEYNAWENDNRKHINTSGYRVQVFSGNNQRTSKGEAFSKEQQIKGSHSEITTYVTYRSPFWRLRIGDFRTYEEAYLLLRQLTKEFPDFGKEMYVVKEEIIIPL